MPIRIRTTVVGAARVGRALSIISESASNLEPVFRVVADVIREAIADEILSEGQGRWEPLTPAYAKRKQLQWGPQPILIASGQLFDSLTVRGHSQHVEVIQTDRMRVGSVNPVLRYHQSGTARQHLPRRAPINFTAEQRQRWIALIGEHISDAN